jgi:sulfur-oxidizing protein SoxA
VAFQSRGLPLRVAIEGPARAAFDRGQAFYNARHGQMNLACAQCHDQNWGKRLLKRRAEPGPRQRVPRVSAGMAEAGLAAAAHPRVPVRHSRRNAAARRARADRRRALPRVASQGLPLEAPGVRR